MNPILRSFESASSEWRVANESFDHPPKVGGYYLGCALRGESCGLGFFSERATHNLQLR